MVQKTLNLLLLLCSFLFTQALASSSNKPFSLILYEFGQNLGTHVPDQILHHLKKLNITLVPLKDHIYSYSDSKIDRTKTKIDPTSTLILSLGNTSISLLNAPLGGTPEIPWESYKLTFNSPCPTANSRKKLDFSNLTDLPYPTLASDGLPLDPHSHTNISFSKTRVSYGAVVGSYAALELLGFAFLHPLDPYFPVQISSHQICSSPHARARNSRKIQRSITTKQCGKSATLLKPSCAVSITESPYWPERSFHIHTQHPLELTEVLQGHDIPQLGPHGPSCLKYTSARGRTGVGLGFSEAMYRNSTSSTCIDETCSTPSTPSTPSTHNNPYPAYPQRSTNGYCERWEDMVGDVNKLFEWCIANRLNKVEWLLLGSYKWGDELDTRHRRMRVLSGLGHEYSLMVGVDVPLGNVQQHGWTIVNTRAAYSQQVMQIKERVG